VSVVSGRTGAFVTGREADRSFIIIGLRVCKRNHTFDSSYAHDDGAAHTVRVRIGNQPFLESELLNGWTDPAQIWQAYVSR